MEYQYGDIIVTNSPLFPVLIFSGLDDEKIEGIEMINCILYRYLFDDFLLSKMLVRPVNSHTPLNLKDLAIKRVKSYKELEKIILEIQNRRNKREDYYVGKYYIDRMKRVF